jgi:hypothetical protein
MHGDGYGLIRAGGRSVNEMHVMVFCRSASPSHAQHFGREFETELSPLTRTKWNLRLLSTLKRGSLIR